MSPIEMAERLLRKCPIGEGEVALIAKFPLRGGGHAMIGCERVEAEKWIPRVIVLDADGEQSPWGFKADPVYTVADAVEACREAVSAMIRFADQNAVKDYLRDKKLIDDEGEPTPAAAKLLNELRKGDPS